MYLLKCFLYPPLRYTKNYGTFLKNPQWSWSDYRMLCLERGNCFHSIHILWQEVTTLQSRNQALYNIWKHWICDHQMTDRHLMSGTCDWSESLFIRVSWEHVCLLLTAGCLPEPFMFLSFCVLLRCLRKHLPLM